MEEKELEKVIEIMSYHEEGDEARNVCDADGLYCRSECVAAAIERLRKAFNHP